MCNFKHIRRRKCNEALNRDRVTGLAYGFLIKTFIKHIMRLMCLINVQLHAML